MMKRTERIGGSLKWSQQEDDILRNYMKSRGGSWEEVSVFLPSRSPCSIEARWKRIMERPGECSKGDVGMECAVGAEEIVETVIS